MLKSDFPYPVIAAFIEKMSKPGSQLGLPEDLPIRFFNLLAIARKQALQLDRTVIGVGRISNGAVERDSISGGIAVHGRDPVKPVDL